MQNLNKRLLRKVLVLNNDELLKKRFWKQVYSRRGIVEGEIIYEN